MRVMDWTALATLAILLAASLGALAVILRTPVSVHQMRLDIIQQGLAIEELTALAKRNTRRIAGTKGGRPPKHEEPDPLDEASVNGPNLPLFPEGKTLQLEDVQWLLRTRGKAP
jgi:hypothetical protein